jgi:capsular exopolysaccharide synthesis family protein
MDSWHIDSEYGSAEMQDMKNELNVNELGIKDYITIISKRRWTLAASVTAALIGFTIFLLCQPAVYQSSSMLMIEIQPAEFSNYPRFRYPAQGMFQEEEPKPLEYYQSVLTSRALRSELIRRLEADDSLWTDLPMRKNDLPQIASHPINLIPSPGYDDFVQLTASSNHPHLSYSLARYATILLKERCQILSREELQNAVNFIEQQKEAARRNLDDAERTLQEFKKKTNLALSMESGGVLKILADMEDKLTTIETEKQFAAANLAAYSRRLAQMESSGPSKSAGVESPQAVRFKEEIARLESQRSALSSTVDPNAPEVKAIDDQIEAKKRELVGQLLKSSKPAGNQEGDAGMSLWKEVYERKITEELNHFVLENRERYYRNLVDDFKRRNPNLMENAVELMRLTRTQTVSENLYAFLLQQGEEARIKAAAGTGGIRVIDMPVLPTKPVPINVKRKLGVFLVLGLGIGLGIIMLQEMLDHSIRSPSDVEEYLGLPVMGQIPIFPSPNNIAKTSIKKGLSRIQPGSALLKKSGKAVKNANGESHPERFIISHFNPKDPVVEAYRILRSNLQFANIDQPAKTLLVSSPNPGEGKTMTTANLGIVLALQGHSVCVIDADLRKPKQHSVFGIKQSPGLTECLIDNRPVSELVQPSGIEHLSVLTSGKTPPNPAEVLGSRKMRNIIADLRGSFDYAIFDSPPVLVVTDAVLLSSCLDGVLLVIKHGESNRFSAADMVNSLRKGSGRIYGVVVNQISHQRGYGYYYSSKKYY